MTYKKPYNLMNEIKISLASQNLTYVDLADKLNMSRQSLYQIFKICNPRLSTLCQICDALNLDISISKRDTK